MVAAISPASLRRNWFYLLLPPCALASFSLARMPEALADPLTLERVLLLDWAIILPIVFALFLRGRFEGRTGGGRAIAVRCAGFALGGIWFAGWLMPGGAGEILPWLGWLRAIFLPVAIAIELVAFVAVMKIAYSAEPDEDKLLSSGMPRWLVRALLAEARFWKWVWRNISGR